MNQVRIVHPGQERGLGAAELPRISNGAPIPTLIDPVTTRGGLAR